MKEENPVPSLFSTWCEVQDRMLVLNKMQNVAPFLPWTLMYFSKTPLEAHQCSINDLAKDREENSIYP